GGGERGRVRREDVDAAPDRRLELAAEILFAVGGVGQALQPQADAGRPELLLEEQHRRLDVGRVRRVGELDLEAVGVAGLGLSPLVTSNWPARKPARWAARSGTIWTS